jgi:hypothetical protein
MMKNNMNWRIRTRIAPGVSISTGRYGPAITFGNGPFRKTFTRNGVYTGVPLGNAYVSGPRVPYRRNKGGLGQAFRRGSCSARCAVCFGFC